MPMTDEERRAARNAASKRWYAAHKAAKKAAAKAGAKQKPAKKVEAKPAKKTGAKAAKPVSGGRDPLREAEKLVKKFAKVAAGIKPMLGDAVEILDRAYRGGDGKYVGKVERVLRKGLGIGIVDDGAKTKAGIEAWSRGIRTPAFRLPAEEPATEEPATEEPATEEPAAEESAEGPKEIPVDPSMLTGVEDGTVTKADLDAQASTVGDEDDEGDDEGDDDEEKDPEDMDDEEYAQYRERMAEKESDAFFEGRAETMRELEEQGAYDD